MAEFAITSGDGVRLSVREHGPSDGPTVVAVHGYPDNQSLWDGMIAALPTGLRVVTYDVRGAGGSDRPSSVAAYRLDRLADDLKRVVDTVSPDRAVHLLAHDWGSIQTWHAVTRVLPPERVASYTSISGPALDHAGAWMRRRMGLGSRPRLRGVGELLRQLAMSNYILFFRTPWLPEQAWRSGVLPRLIRLFDRLPATVRFDPSDGIHGLALYRANMRSRGRGALPPKTVVPVRVLAPTRDPFVSTPLQADIGHWATRLQVRRVPGGHWLPRTRPEIVAEQVSELIGEVDQQWRAPGSNSTAQDRSAEVQDPEDPSGRR